MSVFVADVTANGMHAACPEGDSERRGGLGNAEPAFI